MTVITCLRNSRWSSQLRGGVGGGEGGEKRERRSAGTRKCGGEGSWVWSYGATDLGHTSVSLPHWGLSGNRYRHLNRAEKEAKQKRRTLNKNRYNSHEERPFFHSDLPWLFVQDLFTYHINLTQYRHNRTGSEWKKTAVQKVWPLLWANSQRAVQVTMGFRQMLLNAWAINSGYWYLNLDRTDSLWDPSYRKYNFPQCIKTWFVYEHANGLYYRTLSPLCLIAEAPV